MLIAMVLNPSLPSSCYLPGCKRSRFHHRMGAERAARPKPCPPVLLRQPALRARAANGIGSSVGLRRQEGAPQHSRGLRDPAGGLCGRGQRKAPSGPGPSRRRAPASGHAEGTKAAGRSGSSHLLQAFAWFWMRERWSTEEGREKCKRQSPPLGSFFFSSRFEIRGLERSCHSSCLPPAPRAAVLHAVSSSAVIPAASECLPVGHYTK